MEQVETERSPKEQTSASERAASVLETAIGYLGEAPKTIDLLHSLVRGVVKVGTKIVYGTAKAAIDGINEARAEMKKTE